MSDAIRKGPSAEELAKRAQFEALYCEWHSSRAAFYEDSLPEDDESTRARSDRCDAAERALLTTPAPSDWAIWMKWEALDQIATSDAVAGQYTDNRLILALGAIKADLIRFGIGD
jgi:hypothetical protein